LSGEFNLSNFDGSFLLVNGSTNSYAVLSDTDLSTQNANIIDKIYLN
jgi:hypothetical protein